MNNVTKIIKKYRQAKKVSQVDLAKFLGWASGQFVSNIEKGLSEWPKEVIPKVCKKLQIPHRELWAAYQTDCQLEFKDLL